MIVDRLTRSDTRAGVERSARVRWNGGELVLRVEAPASHSAPGHDASPFVPPCLLPAMRAGETLEVDGPVSPLLARGLRELREFYAAWAPELRGGELRVAEERESLGGGTGVGSLFSRGVDSTYSAASPRLDPAAPLTELIYVDGVEPAHDANVRAEEVRLARVAAERVGLPLTVVTTNVRELTDGFVRDWMDIVGAGLALPTLSLAGELHHVVYPSSDTPMSVGPSGGNPMIDHLYSTEAVRIEHDSVARGRMGKVAWLAAERPELLRDLKVCFVENRPDNCGRCTKCVRTMAALVAVGRLEEAAGFPDELDPALVAELDIPALHTRVEWVEIARELDPARHGELHAAIETALARPLHSPPLPDDSPSFRRRQTQLYARLMSGAT